MWDDRRFTDPPAVIAIGHEESTEQEKEEAKKWRKELEEKIKERKKAAINR